MPTVPARFIALMLGVLGVGCRTEVKPPIGEDRSVPPQRGGILRTAFYTDVRGLDPATAYSTTAAAIQGLVFDRLVKYDRKGRIVGELAKSIDTTPDGKKHVFTLRRGVRFHDGELLTATDVKRSIERALHTKTPCPGASYYDRISGFKEFHSGKTKNLSGVSVEGPHTLSIALSEPDATFLHALTMFFLAPVCKSAGSVFSRNFSVKPCGSGPFRVTHYENGQIIKLRRHDGYWQKDRPYLDGIDWYLTMQSFTQRFKFEDGALDYMRDFNDVDSLLFRTHPKWKGRGEWESAMTTAGAFMNTEMPPFDNRHVRRAVAFALNRDQIAMIRRGHVEPHYKIVPNAIIPDAEDYPKQRHDLQQALKEMRLAGYPYDPNTGKGGYPKEIPYIALLESMGQQAAVLYQQQLKKIGIRLRLQLVGWPTFLAKTGRRRTTPMGTAGWHADFAEAGAFFEPILTSRSIMDDGAQNASFFSNKRLDQLISDARRIVDPDARNKLYRQAEAIVRDEAPWATTYSYRYYELWQPYVHGYKPHPVASQDVRGMWLDAGGRKQAAAGMPCWQGIPSPRGCSHAGPRTTLAMVLGVRR